eukprot:1155393-Pelagomonas_calceolata.AAC.5
MPANKRPRASRKGSLTSKLAWASPKNSQTLAPHLAQALAQNDGWRHDVLHHDERHGCVVAVQCRHVLRGVACFICEGSAL